ncbi:type II toxin-antitoxin system RelE/ParE family toxin [Sphingosinicellaceae bacterium]|nr:type II toxin-antitoxin system RelE/ParE family toxin [Sphingosinicellaceae bacterium]
MYEVKFDPRASNDILTIFAYVSAHAGANVASAYVRRLEARCRAMGDAPLAGSPHDELLPGLRTAPFERRATIAYTFDREVVTILQVIHAGRDIGASFS